MANSTSYLVQTRNRCVVGVYGDTVGTITFGITNSAFDSTNHLDTRITNSSASLSRVVYGLSGPNVVLRFGATGGTAFVLGANSSGSVDFERITIPNNAVSPADGTFKVEIPATGTILTAYLEFVPF
jgi:hypothetical protein